jgi:hypothetical protein
MRASDRSNGGCGGDAEMLVELLVRADAPKPVMPMNKPSEPMKTVPALADAGLDSDLDRRNPPITAFLYSMLCSSNRSSWARRRRGWCGHSLPALPDALHAISTSEPEAKIVTSASLAETRS